MGVDDPLGTNLWTAIGRAICEGALTPALEVCRNGVESLLPLGTVDNYHKPPVA
jgi:hypothetical protein